VLLYDYLTDAQMVELMRGTTYYVTATHAEGACLPLQEALAAGRPAIAPRHTSLVDYFDEGLGWVVRSSPEPTWFTPDPEMRLLTTWHRLDWQSLCDQLRASYEVARHHPQQYRQLARRGRQRMHDYATAERVFPRLLKALGHVWE
jgi:glycosyltransferase involved in cell wall biosynthesis